MQPLVSVIVPVYRVEKYLSECVNSILAQTLSSVEVILVDDGSDDHCPKMCDILAKQYENIKVIHQSNKGPSAARNAGVDKANGKYIAFCDSDDIMQKNMLERMATTAQNYDAEIVMCGYETFPNGRVVYPGVKCNEVLTAEQFISTCDTMHTGNELCFSWRFLINKKFLEEKKLRFDECLLFGEDVPFNLHALMEARRIFVLPDALYCYRINNVNSIMRTKYKPNLEALIERQYKKKMELTYRYKLDKNPIWMKDLRLYYITGFADMLFRNAMHAPVEMQKKMVRRVIRMPLFADNLKKSRKCLFYRGRINAVFWLACILKVDWFVWWFVKKNYS